jgi:hypothetical protein
MALRWRLTFRSAGLALIVLLIVGLVALWLWVRANPLGALGVFLAEIFLFGPAAHPGWSWSNPDDEWLIAGFAAVALAPILLKALAIYLHSEQNARRLINRSLPSDETFSEPLVSLRSAKASSKRND